MKLHALTGLPAGWLAVLISPVDGDVLYTVAAPDGRTSVGQRGKDTNYANLTSRTRNVIITQKSEGLRTEAGSAEDRF
jgi:hypothetical protein